MAVAGGVALMGVAGAALAGSSPEGGEGTGVSVGVSPVLPSETDRRLMWSPRGTQLAWSAEMPDDWPEAIREFASDLIDPVFGELRIGPEDAEPRAFMLSRTDPDRAYREVLVLDSLGDGRIDPEREVFEAEARDVRGRMWVTHAPVVIEIDYGPAPEGWPGWPGEKEESEEEQEAQRITAAHEFSFWHTYPREGDEPSEVLRYTRRSWLEGEAELLGRRFRVQLIDANNDALYTTADRWTLEAMDDSAGGESGEGFTTEARTGISLREPFFIDGQAYRMTDLSMCGSWPRLEPTDDEPEIPEEDPGPERPRSEHELAWLKDLDEAKREAAAQSRPLMVKWTAVWCGPCRTMEREAFRDKVVVETLRSSFVIVELDSDEQHRLAREHEVRALPTIQFFNAEGEEVDRRTGLQTPERMEAWLEEVRSSVGSG